MKKLLAFVFLPIALILAAESYQNTFNAWLTDGKLEVADSILRAWSQATPDDPELYPARFNLFLNRARSTMLVLSDESGQKNEELVLEDSTGNEAGYIYEEVTWQDSLVSLALEEIDRGIAACPDRIDFRLGKASAASMTGRWDAVIDAVDALIDRYAENGGRWLNTGNVVDSMADTLLVQAVHDRLVEIYNSESREVVESAMPLVAKAVKRFGNDVKILNIAGGMSFGIGKDEDALKYFKEASRIAPDDAIPLTNIGYLYYQQGDTVKALEAYRKIENGNYDENSRDIARRMIAEITTPIEDMKEYFYFFRYLPQIAAQVEAPEDFLDIETINSLIPSYNKLRSPFADADIKVDDIPEEGDEPRIVVWTFPMPEEIPMCRYVAFVEDGNGHYKVFTLEKSLEDYWVVGTMKDTTHSNFGNIPYPADAAEFAKALRQMKILK